MQVDPRIVVARTEESPVLSIERRYTLILLALAISAIALRSIHVTSECRISWDEGRPDVERLINTPDAALPMLSRSWGRPGLEIAKCGTLLFFKAISRLLIQLPVPEWIPAQILLDVGTMLLMAFAGWKASNQCNPAIAWQVSLITAALWAFSPGAVYWSHRFMAPTYAMFGLTATIVALQRASAGGWIRWLTTGAIAGMTFTVYPGSYVPLGMLIMIYASQQFLLRRVIIRLLAVAFSGGAILILMEVLTRLSNQSEPSTGLSYFKQLSSLRQTITHGHFEDGLFALVSHCIRFKDATLAIAASSVSIAVLWRRRWIGPAGWAFFGSWLYFVNNSAILHREVFYDRLVVLLTPLGCIAVAELISRCTIAENPRFIKFVTTSALCVMPVISGIAVLNWNLIRVRADDVLRLAAAELGVSSKSFHLISDLQDYGDVADHHRQSILDQLTQCEAEETLASTLVAFNLRSDWYVAEYPTTSTFDGIRPVLRFPGQGLDRDCRDVRCVSFHLKLKPESPTKADDIKIYRAADLLAVLRSTPAVSQTSYPSRRDLSDP